MSGNGVPVFRRWCCSAAAALLLHGLPGWYLTRAPIAAPATLAPPSPLLWVEQPGSLEAPPTTSSPAEPAQPATHPLRPRAPARPAAAAPRATSAARQTAALAARQTAALAAADPALTSDGSAAAAAVASDTGAGDTAAGSEAPGDTAAGNEAPGDGARARAAVGPGAGSSARLLRNAACADLFPYSARSDRGTVEVALDVALSGQAVGAQIVDEAPRGQGFALAARHCVRRLRFSPALDASGQAIASRSVVQLRFERRRETARASL